GDLVAFAAEEVVIDGTVNGSVIAFTPRVVVNGEVAGSLRAVGSQLEVEGRVGGDVVASVWSADLSPDSDVAGDVLLWAWDVAALGRIGQDLTGTQRHLDLGGEVEGDIDVTVDRLTVVDPLVVGGDLGYRSSNEAVGVEQAQVGGVVVEKAPLPPNLRVRALRVLGRFMVVLFLTVAALTTAYGWPDRTSRAISSVGSRPLRNWLTGASIFFAPLLAVLATAVILGLAPAAVAFPLLAVLIPLILAMLGLSLALGLVAGVPTVGWLGGVLFRRLEVYGSILTGSILAGLVWYVPWVGWLVPLVILPLGLGAWVSTWRDQPSGLSESGVSSTI
ncbi:MAG: polymer-forming cytoskeletal protein, partial [Acidimicrobiia bacterium]